ncbi:PREDICTED: uncharacterized protein LOC105556006 [Vollenhovia emeryi]|uniref:uncharacterized protein LOC105556006 n=1 Tax=Vollenhovia emeryi TaxID=411798 RepID=UPI0005F39BC9|nr:PREDICTED: uncharacterized protein LOC105556006 [Vollenhovia emeryi]
MHQWRAMLESNEPPGLISKAAIVPEWPRWFNRRWGKVHFHMTQLLSGHGCFSHFLWKIGKSADPTCHHCGAAEDTSEHTLVHCPAWTGEREELLSDLGVDDDFTLQIVVAAALETKEKWKAFSKFSSRVMLAKEDAERAREMNDRDPAALNDVVDTAD